jgi:hypothetical protein
MYVYIYVCMYNTLLLTLNIGSMTCYCPGQQGARCPVDATMHDQSELDELVVSVHVPQGVWRGYGVLTPRDPLPIPHHDCGVYVVESGGGERRVRAPV